MSNLNQINGNGSPRRNVGYAMSNITSEGAVSVKDITTVTTEDYGLHKTLKDVIGKNTTSEYKTTLLLKISHCLLRIKNYQNPLDELSPSEIFIREKDLANESISHIGKTFFHILTGNKLRECSEPVLSEGDCDDHFTAQDLIEQMINEEDFTIEDVLLHPLFWSEQDKIIFICNIYDRIVPECKIENGPVLKGKTKKAVENCKIDVEKDNVIPGGWIEKLPLQSENLRNEIAEIKQKNPRIDIKKDTISNCAFKIDVAGLPVAKFDTNSIFELMRFFRLHHAHYWEKGKIIQAAFGDYSKGYWNFYQRRYPKLLIHVYHAVEDRFGNDNFPINIAPFRYFQK